VATKGRTDVGATALNIESRLCGRAETFTAGDEITAVSAYTICTTVDKLINAALYDMATGNRLALGTAQTQTAGTTAWRTIPLSYTVSSITDIMIVVQSEGGSGDGQVYFDTNSAVTHYYDASAGQSYPPPSTWTTDGWGTDADRDISVYATYTEAGGGSVAPLAAVYYGMLRSR
jgi:hypothetical protein